MGASNALYSLISESWLDDAVVVSVISGATGSFLSSSCIHRVRGRLVVITDVKTKSCRVNVSVAPKEQSAKDWLGEDVEDTVEDSFGIRSNNIATLGQTPGNWVDEP